MSNKIVTYHTKERMSMVTVVSGDNAYSSSWFVACFSSEVLVGQVKTARLCGVDIVLYRGVDGGICAVEPHCPHLGAHLGNGRVVNGEIECPFHGFRFDSGGVCTHSYPGKKPAKAVLEGYRVIERLGMVFVWVGAVEDIWEFPDIDVDGWSGLVEFQKPLAARQQNVLENLVDFGHLNLLHNVRDYSLDSAVVDHGNVLEYSMMQRVEKPALKRLVSLLTSIGIGWIFPFVREYNPNPGLHYRSFFGLSSTIALRFKVVGVAGGVIEIETNHAIANKYILRQLIFPSPSDGGYLTYRTAFQFKRRNGVSFNGGLGGWFEKLQLKFLAVGAYQEILDEMFIWESQAHQSSPKLADGDGPIGKYRKFMRKYHKGYQIIPSANIE